MPNRMLEEIKQTRPFTSRQEEAALNVLRTADALKRGVELLLKRHGISFGPVQRAANTAWRRSRRGLHCGGIAERLITAEPDITRLLMRMEKLGLLVRRRESDDQRVVTATATKRGLSCWTKWKSSASEIGCKRQQF